MFKRRSKTRSGVSLRLCGITLLAALIAGMSGSMTAHSAAAIRSTTITVNATKTLAIVSDTAIGVNTAVWDPYLTAPDVPSFLQKVHTEILRYPGGSTADTYHWQTNTTSPSDGGQAGAANGFDSFMTQVAQPAHAEVMITVNYGSNVTGTAGGSPDEAAAWVRAANLDHHYGVQNWEIGNEIYGNGYYGAQWETDLHKDHSPTAYGENALAYSRAMKAVDPSIHIGLVLVPPGAWPEGRGPQDWNKTVLAHACSAADFVSIHWYAQNPGHESDPGLLASVRSIPESIKTLRAQMQQACGPRGAEMPIMLTETNSVSSAPGKQTLSPINALFLIEDYLQWVQAGVQNVSWWDLHNGGTVGNASRKLVGKSAFGDYGLLAFQNTPSPYPSFRALQLVAPLLAPGSSLLAVKSSAGGVRAYAVKSPTGVITIVAVNGTAKPSYRLKIRMPGNAAPDRASVTTYGVTTRHPTTKQVSLRKGYILAPYTAALFQLGT